MCMSQCYDIDLLSFDAKQDAVWEPLQQTKPMVVVALAKQQRLSDREAVGAVLALGSNGAGVGNLKDC